MGYPEKQYENLITLHICSTNGLAGSTNTCGTPDNQHHHRMLWACCTRSVHSTQNSYHPPIFTERQWHKGSLTLPIWLICDHTSLKNQTVRFDKEHRDMELIEATEYFFFEHSSQSIWCHDYIIMLNLPANCWCQSYGTKEKQSIKYKPE
jgi:hypothetical protein